MTQRKPPKSHPWRAWVPGQFQFKSKFDKTRSEHERSLPRIRRGSK